MNPSCVACGSPSVRTFDSEANIHLPSRNGIDMASIFIFPRFQICLDCGHMESDIPKSDLQLLKEGCLRPFESTSSNAA
jgi:hypothetical protein